MDNREIGREYILFRYGNTGESDLAEICLEYFEKTKILQMLIGSLFLSKLCQKDLTNCQWGQ